MTDSHLHGDKGVTTKLHNDMLDSGYDEWHLYSEASTKTATASTPIAKTEEECVEAMATYSMADYVPPPIVRPLGCAADSQMNPTVDLECFKGCLFHLAE